VATSRLHWLDAFDPVALASNHGLERTRGTEEHDQSSKMIAVDPYASVLPFIGYSAGVIGAYLLSKRIIRGLSSDSFQPRLVVWFGVAGGLIALFPAFFLSIVVGGTFGGSFGEVSGQSVGLGKVGVLIGVPLGLALVLAAPIAAGVLMGSLLGRLVHWIWWGATAI
jgi:hypothetical protein